MAAPFNYSKSVYSQEFSFEKNFDEDSFYKWIDRNWTLSMYYSAIYVTLIFGGRKYMNSKPRFELRWCLALWSGVLAVFSIMGAVRTIPELIYVIRNYGLEFSMCNPSYFYGPTAFWAYTFTISKVYELGDTVFIVLRKQQLIFLHWYHHITVLIYVWYSYTDHTAPGRWFMVMNYTVHAFMYSYYCLRAMKFRIPKPVSMFITAIQILQMTVGVAVNIQTYRVKSRGEFCQVSLENMRYCFIMYFSYFLLFAYFFYNAYIVSKGKGRSSSSPVTVKNTAEVLDSKKVQWMVLCQYMCRIKLLLHVSCV